MAHQEINFSQFKSNVLDFVGRKEIKMLPENDNTQFTNIFDNLTPEVLKAIYLQLLWSNYQKWLSLADKLFLSELNNYIWEEYNELMIEIRKRGVKEFYSPEIKEV